MKEHFAKHSKKQKKHSNIKIKQRKKNKKQSKKY